MLGRDRAQELQALQADGRVKCLVCPQACVIGEGRRGACWSTVNEGGRLALSCYGQSSGFCIDPIEKKPLYHFLPGTPILSFGTTGCNLSCKFCQNCDISMNQRKERLSARARPEDIVDGAIRAGCRSIAFTYNEPTAFLEYAVDVAQLARERGLKTVAVTNGYVHGRAREMFYEQMDAANVDLKSFSEGFYSRLCGAQLAPVLETLEYIRNCAETWLEVTTLIIPGENDGAAELEELCGWIGDRLGPDTPVHLSAFHPQHKLLHVPRTPSATVIKARERALELGLRHVYTGNIHNPDGESTWCADCGQLLISRTGYEIGAWRIKGGMCDACKAPVPGVYDEEPGDWGSRRAQLEI